MSPLPDLTDTSTFLTFSECPILDASSPPAPTTHPRYLLGTLAENMTLSTSPTFIAKDRIDVSFALTIRLPASLVDEGKYMGGFDASAFKKGCCVVVTNPGRKGVREGKAGFVEARVEDVAVIPTSLNKLLLVSQYERALLAQNESGGETGETCGACGKRASAEHVLVRCKGCHGVWYCGKACQVKGWSENGHKSECKVLKAAGEIWS